MIPSQLANVWDKARKKAAETLGTVQPLTEFPAEFLELQSQIQHTQASIDSLLGYCKCTSSSTTFFSPQGMSSSLQEMFHKVSAAAASASSLSSPPTTEPNEQPTSSSTTIHHRQALQLRQSADNLPYGSELASLLGELANAQTLMAEARIEFERAIALRVKPALKALKGGEASNVGSLAASMEAIEAAEAARWALNEQKSRVKRAEASELVKLQQPLQQAQDAFLDAVEHAVRTMKAACEQSQQQMLGVVGELRKAEAKYYAVCAQLMQSYSTSE